MRNQVLGKQLSVMVFLSLMFILSTSCGTNNREIQDGRGMIEVSPSPVRTTTLKNTVAPPSPTSSSTVTASSTAKPTIMPASTSTPGILITILPYAGYTTLDSLSGDPLMLLVDIGYDGIYLRNIFTEETWQIFDEHPDLPFTANFVAWGRAGCEVIVGPHLSVGGSLLRLDLKGNILQVIHSFANLNAVVTNVKLSPSKDKMAYEAVGREYHSEDGSYSGQFLEVIYLNTLSTPYVISERNAGEDTLAWSTDGEWLAYAEYDEKDVMQVHISRPDGNEQRQLTQFTDPNAELSSLEWSPDGQRIAFRFAPNPNASPDSAVTIVTVQDQQPQVEFVEIEGAGRISDFWWQNEEILVLSSGSIYWFEITDREVIDVLQKSTVPDKYIGSARRFDGSSLIGFTSKNNFYIYDPDNRHLWIMPEIGISFDKADWVPVPATFPGMEACQP